MDIKLSLQVPNLRSYVITNQQNIIIDFVNVKIALRVTKMQYFNKITVDDCTDVISIFQYIGIIILHINCKLYVIA